MVQVWSVPGVNRWLNQTGTFLLYLVSSFYKFPIGICNCSDIRAFFPIFMIYNIFKIIRGIISSSLEKIVGHSSDIRFQLRSICISFHRHLNTALFKEWSREYHYDRKDGSARTIFRENSFHVINISSFGITLHLQIEQEDRTLNSSGN